MKRTTVLVSLSFLLICSIAVTADEKKTAPEKKTAAPTAKAPDHQMFTPARIAWTNAPAVLPAGAKVSVLEGDPQKEGYFAMRLWMPGGYKIMPHWHPGVERITVLSGAFHVGLGDTFDETKGQSMPAGTYATLQPKVHHYGWTKGETEVQITTIGPWKLVYVNPQDDPSVKKEEAATKK